jgi:MoaA/NifB/PqqE/SkfB family radical SAM enzyme
MDKSSTWCVMPHLGMALQNHSDFCTCNVNKASWQNNKREVMHVYNGDTKMVYQSHTRKMIAAALDHGIKHPSCQKCWDQEQANNKSPRQTFNQMFEHLTPLPDQPRVLIIKPGNTCNFACRMCNPITSSSWYADGYELEQANLISTSWYATDQTNQVSALSYNEYTRTFENIRNSYNRDNVEFWNTLKGWLPNLVFINIYGGEPFLIPALFDFLKHGVEIGASSGIELSIHTNASILNAKYLEILGHYQTVSFNVSIDSTDPAQLEYIRHKANFKTVIENSKIFKSMSDRYDNIDMSVTDTITPLNVYYTNSTVTELSRLLDLPVNINIVTTPEYDIRHLPTPIKQFLIKELDSEFITNFLQKSISGCDVEWPRFCRATDKLDQLRGQSFANTFPEWWNMLEPYWIK